MQETPLSPEQKSAFGMCDSPSPSLEPEHDLGTSATSSSSPESEDDLGARAAPSLSPEQGRSFNASARPLLADLKSDFGMCASPSPPKRVKVRLWHELAASPVPRE